MIFIKKYWLNFKRLICKIMEESFFFDGFSESISAADVFCIVFDVEAVLDNGQTQPIIIVILNNGAQIRLPATENNIYSAKKLLQ